MNHAEKLNSFKNNSIANYPSLKSYDFENSLNLVANFKIPISKKVISQINTFVETIFSISRKPEYKSFILNNNPHYQKLLQANNYSVLMSYDFHIDENNNAQLIEINTNASSYLIGNEISKLLDSKDYTQELKNAFLNEFSKFDQPVKNIAIIDDNPKDQFMYLEFLMFKDLFTSWGYKCSILDYKSLKYDGTQLIDTDGAPIDFIYNRYCDFDLSDSSSNDLLSAYTKNQCLLSPNPKEYLLLADKNRMIEWNTGHWRESLELNTKEIDILDQTLIPSKPINQFNPEELWANKKNYFLKPTQSFGGKSVYRGKSLTKKTFERLISTDTLVQKFVPAQSLVADEQKWKYDFRAYAYKDKVQYILARAYQGQVTNLQTLGGGLALVDIVD